MDVFVRRGDTLWHYSQMFSIPLQLILDSNREIQAENLQIGQTARIPGFVAVDYQINHGDTISYIAEKWHLSQHALFLVNPNIDPMRLEVGQTIKIPQRMTWRLVQGKKEYDYHSMMMDLARLQRIYPFLRISSIGRSVLDNSIPEVLIGNGPKQVHYNASFHGNEWITTAAVMTFLNDYLLALTNQTPIRGLVMERFYRDNMLSMVPMVNPDGVNLVLNGPPADAEYEERVIELNHGKTDFTGWKANIRGVDLNDQFPARWELEKERNQVGPGPRDYAGERPLTEPEAIAMAELTQKRNFSRVLAFHTQGEVIYWGFENLEPQESQSIVAEFGRVSGYQPVKTIDSYAGYKDWFVQDWRRPGFTVELGFGVNPLPLSQFDKIYQEALGIFLAGLYF